MKLKSRIRCTIVGLALSACSGFAVASTTDAAASPAATAPAAAMHRWSVVLPKDEKVGFRGGVSFDQAGGGTGAMLYPAPNLVGLLAAVLTHSVMADSAQKAEKARIQEAADKVLVPYQPVLEGFRHQDLMQSGLSRSRFGGDRTLLPSTEPKPAGRWIVESAPMFTLTQDQRALVLDNVVVLRSPQSPEASAYQGVIRVVSHPQESTDLAAHWTADQGSRLKTESAELFAESLDMAMGLAVGTLVPSSEVQKTVRYPEGGTERMERAQIVAEGCGRLIIKTLRGWMMSVPTRDGVRAPCAVKTEVAAQATPAAGK